MSIPIYYFSLFMCPQSIILQIEKAIRNFLQHASNSNKKHHWVGWKRISKPFQFGGLAIRNLKKMNKCLLMKWWWRLGRERNALWENIVEEKYGFDDGGWRTKQCNAAHGVSIWKQIGAVQDDFFDKVQFKIGKGNKIRVWEDKWFNQGSMADLCPNLYRTSIAKFNTISEAYCANSDGFYWELGITHRRFNEVEIGELSLAFSMLDSIVFYPDEEDSLVWLRDNSGNFSVKSAYYLSTSDSTSASFPHKHVWSKAWPHKVSFFLWQCVLDRLPTLDNLQKRGYVLVTPSGNPRINVFCLCKQGAESNAHLFLTCSFTTQIWRYFCLESGRSVNLTGTTLDITKNWSTTCLSLRGKEVWIRLYAAIFWVTWLERNNRTFNSKERKVEDIINDIKLKVFQWESYTPCMSGFSTTDVIVNWRELFFIPP